VGMDRTTTGAAYGRDGRERTLRLRRVAALTGLEAFSLAVASALHLSGLVTGRTAAFDADGAGIAEALIGVVLAAAAVALWRGGRWGRRLGLYAVAFSIVGFLWGLDFSARSGHWPDIAYHVSVLTLLVASFVVLLRICGPVDRRDPDA